MPQEAIPRVDPKPRSVDAGRQCVISNKDPNREYMLCNPNDEHTGLQSMLDMELDFQVETMRKDGPRIKGGRTSREGDQIMFKGQVLVSCPLSKWREYQQAGWDIAEDFDRRSVQPGGADRIVDPTGSLARQESKARFGPVRM